MTTLRRLRSEEWQAYRDLRLRALVDSPDAFGSTYGREALLPDSHWIERVGLGASSADDLPLVAEDGAELVGLAWGRIMPAEADTAHVYQMWVAPECRGRGIGKKLLDAVMKWAREAGAEALVLGVTCGNGTAEQLYAGAGFEPNGDPQPLRPGSSLLSQRMILQLVPLRQFQP